MNATDTAWLQVAPDGATVMPVVLPKPPKPVLPEPPVLPPIPVPVPVLVPVPLQTLPRSAVVGPGA